MLDFEDILSKNKPLATKLCNEQGTNNFWLQEAVNAFFNANGVQTKKAAIGFRNMPIRYLTSLCNSIQCLYTLAYVLALGDWESPAPRKVAYCRAQKVKQAGNGP